MQSKLVISEPDICHRGKMRMWRAKEKGARKRVRSFLRATEDLELGRIRSSMLLQAPPISMYAVYKYHLTFTFVRVMRDKRRRSRPRVASYGVPFGTRHDRRVWRCPTHMLPSGDCTVQYSLFRVGDEVILLRCTFTHFEY